MHTHCACEARVAFLACRLDVMPGIMRKFRSNGDAATAQLLEDVVYRVRSPPRLWVPTAVMLRHVWTSPKP